MRSIILYTSLIALCPLLLIAQAPDTLWTRKYGGDSTEVASSVQQTNDEGYVICGITYSYGQGTPSYDNVYLIKTDIFGDTLWTRVYENPYSYEAYSMQQTNDMGFIIAGSVGLFPDKDGFLIKTDSLGDTLWTRIYTRTGRDYFSCVQQVSASIIWPPGYIMVGVCEDTAGGIYLVRTDSLGIMFWSKSIGSSASDGGKSIQQTTDGGFIIGGSISGNYDDCYLVKTGSNGDTLWTRTFGGSSSDYIECVQQTLDGGYIIGGRTASFGPGDYDVYTVKTDSLGNELWEKNYGGEGDQYCAVVRQTVDSGYVCAGLTTDYWGNAVDAYIIKLDASGDSIWTIVLGLSGSRGESFNDIQLTSDGGYIAAGWAGSYGLVDLYVAKIAPDTLGIEEQGNVSEQQTGNGATIIYGPLQLPEGKNCKVFDITGRVVMPDKIKPGIYFIQVDGKITQKVIKIK